MSANFESDNFKLWKRVVQDQYPDRPDSTYAMLLQHAASDWGNNNDTNVAKLFEHYVMLKQLMKPEGDRNGD